MSDDPRRPHDRMRRLIGPAAAPLYGAAVAWRNGRFDRGIGVKRVPVPVVSVGNLTVGGTGKTPFVAWLCGGLRERGLKAAVAMRGYRADRNLGRCDEAEEYRRLLPGTPVIVNPDRFAGITGALAERPLDAVVLDDGFQHRRLHRDLDIVLIDAQADTPTDRLLPAGDLREPFGNVARAGAVVITHAEDAAAAAAAAAALAPLLRPGVPVSRAQHRWGSLAVHDAGNDLTWKPEWLRGKRVIALCGIARPERFLGALTRLGCDVRRVFLLRDHQPIRDEMVCAVAQAAATHVSPIVVTTGKDFARLPSVPEPWRGLTIVRPELALSVEPAGPLLECVERALGDAGRRVIPTIAR